MLIYLFLIGEIIALSVMQKRLRNTYLLIITISLTLIVGLRPFSLGTDTHNYVNFFTDVANGKVISTSIGSIFSSGYEIGFVNYIKALTLVTHNPRILLLVSAIIVYGLLLFYIQKESKNPALSFLLFIPVYLSQSMNVMRQAIAVAILMMAFLALKRNKNLLAIGLVLIAFLFHRSALIFLLVLLLKNKKFNLKNVVITITGTLLITILFPLFFKLIVHYFSNYSYYYSAIGGLNIKPALVINIVLDSAFLLISMIQFDKTDTENNLYRWMLLLAICVNIISNVFTGFDRFGLIFLFSQIILVPNSLAHVKNQKLKILMILLVAVICILNFVVTLVYRPEWSQITPYGL